MIVLGRSILLPLGGAWLPTLPLFWGGDLWVPLYPDVHQSPLSSVAGGVPSFVFQNLYLPESSLNKSQLHLCPNPRLPACQGTFILFGVGRNWLP